jgi:hypothetical protein
MNKQIKILFITFSVLLIFLSTIFILFGLNNKKSNLKIILNNTNITEKKDITPNIIVKQPKTQNPLIDNQKTAEQNQISDNTKNQTDQTNIESTKNILENIQIEISGLNIFKTELLNNDTAFTTLIRVAQYYNFNVKYQNYGDMGNLITCINNICNNQNHFWFLYYNGKSSSIGASSLILKNNDVIEWKFE